MTVVVAKPEHEVAYQDLLKLIGKHRGVTALEMLAIGANAVGKLIAMQDQRTVSGEMAMEIVMKNIESGNAQALEMVGAAGGTKQ